MLRATIWLHASRYARPSRKGPLPCESAFIPNVSEPPSSLRESCYPSRWPRRLRWRRSDRDFMCREQRGRYTADGDPSARRDAATDGLGQLEQLQHAAGPLLDQQRSRRRDREHGGARDRGRVRVGDHHGDCRFGERHLADHRQPAARCYGERHRHLVSRHWRHASLTAVALTASSVVLTGRTATWSSSSTQIATVNQAGLVTAVAAGTASIRATIDGVVGQLAVTGLLLVGHHNVGPGCRGRDGPH